MPPMPRPVAVDEFADRHVVVTGGTGSLGRAVVEMLIEGGAHVHVPCFRHEELKSFDLGEHERVHVTEKVDLSDEHKVELFYSVFAAGRGVPLWASIHLAGGFMAGSIHETRKAHLEAELDKNLTSCYLTCREASRRMMEALTPTGLGAGGRIVNVAARPALEPRTGAGMTAYAVAKAGVAALTQALGEELRHEGIWVNAIVPSVLDTPANRAAMPGADFGLWPKPREVAETIVHLASPNNLATRSALLPVYGRS